jgi:hypothetical protein
MFCTTDDVHIHVSEVLCFVPHFSEAELRRKKGKIALPYIQVNTVHFLGFRVSVTCCYLCLTDGNNFRLYCVVFLET